MTPSERRLVTCGLFRPAQGGAEDTKECVCGIRGVFRPAQGGADDTEERVYSMVSLFDVFPRQAVESDALLFSRPADNEGRLHGFQACERVGLRCSDVKRALTKWRKTQ